jgi:hypothetical protein
MPFPNACARSRERVETWPFFYNTHTRRQPVCPIQAGKIRLALKGRDGMMARMNEVEIYAPGVRQPDKIMGLNLELDGIPNLRYKVDTNHDIVYMEFGGEVPSLDTLESFFRKIDLEPRLVGLLPEQGKPGKKTQKIV